MKRKLASALVQELDDHWLVMHDINIEPMILAFVDIIEQHISTQPPRDQVLDELRPEVLLFALSMERKLRIHDKKRGKAGWHFEGEESEGRRFLLRRLKEEIEELEEAMDDCPPFGSFYGEAIDVGNFSMMISYFDRWGSIQNMISEATKELRTTTPAGDQ